MLKSPNLMCVESGIVKSSHIDGVGELQEERVLRNSVVFQYTFTNPYFGKV